MMDIDLISLSAQQGAVHLDKQLILIDNFGGDPRDNERAEIFVNHPVKLSFTVVIFCLEGSMNFQINLQEYQLRAGEMLVVMQGTIGVFRECSPDARVAVIAFGEEYFRGTTLVEETMNLQQLLHDSPQCHLPQAVMEECMTIYRLMKTKIGETDNPFRKGAVEGYAQVLTFNAYNCLLSARKTNDNQTKRGGRHYELYQLFIKDVQENYTRERGISFYANLLCVTPKYLSQVVREVSGRLAGEWITDFVVLEAKALLKSRRYTVQQIADRLHFASQSFFGKYFKEKTGMSPSEYQRK